MQTTTNVFLDGLITDTHPLTTKGTQLTDALNATLRTYNGNEMILQNDMGNTLILDSLTGKTILLSDGFIPVGMKEYGGILYIASYNPDTKEGEIGSIPSPLIKYTYDSLPYPFSGQGSDIALINDSNLLNTDEKHLGGLLTDSIFIISDKVLKVGDLFIPTIKIDENGVETDTWGGSNKKTYPTISTSTNTGYIKVIPYSITETRGIVLLEFNKQITKFGTENVLGEPWFYFSNQESAIDLNIAVATPEDYYYVYPNIPRGLLAFGIEAELPTNILFITNTTTGINSPFYYYSDKTGSVPSTFNQLSSGTQEITTPSITKSEIPTDSILNILHPFDLTYEQIESQMPESWQENAETVKVR